jgi:hypothetical protein
MGWLNKIEVAHRGKHFLRLVNRIISVELFTTFLLVGALIQIVFCFFMVLGTCPKVGRLVADHVEICRGSLLFKLQLAQKALFVFLKLTHFVHSAVRDQIGCIPARLALGRQDLGGFLSDLLNAFNVFVVFVVRFFVLFYIFLDTFALKSEGFGLTLWLFGVDLEFFRVLFKFVFVWLFLLIIFCLLTFIIFLFFRLFVFIFNVIIFFVGRVSCILLSKPTRLILQRSIFLEALFVFNCSLEVEGVLIKFVVFLSGVCSLSLLVFRLNLHV